MIEVALLVVIYLAWGGYLATRMVWTDGEFGLLPAGAAQQIGRFRAEYGVTPALVDGVARLPFRLPGAYWLYAWAPHVSDAWQRPLGRALSLLISAGGVLVLLIWARELAGMAGMHWALGLLLASATLVGSYATASYEGLISTGWMVGLYAAWHDAPLLAVACGIALALVRASALPQSLALWALAASWWGLWAGLVVFGWLWWYQREVLASNGWVRLIRHEDSVPFMPRDGWAYGLRVLAQRYEPWILFVPMAWVGLAWARGPRVALVLFGLTVVVLFVAHAPRSLIRPKWVIGYLADFALPVILVAAVACAALGPVGWILGGIGLTWGILRPRHPAIA